uniref:Uncharacterized protein LOC114347285 isoform X2 n=1 Tax=Diabrotica virgifera virgifera TaxID=50390 RepID=A0A6P7H5J0_DIAVI
MSRGKKLVDMVRENQKTLLIEGNIENSNEDLGQFQVFSTVLSESSTLLELKHSSPSILVDSYENAQSIDFNNRRHITAESEINTDGYITIEAEPTTTDDGTFKDYTEDTINSDDSIADPDFNPISSDSDDNENNEIMETDNIDNAESLPILSGEQRKRRRVANPTESEINTDGYITIEAEPTTTDDGTFKNYTEDTINSDAIESTSSDIDDNENNEIMETDNIDNAESLPILSGEQRKRRRVADPTMWKKNQRTTKRQKGEAYISVRGKKVPEKRVKEKDCSKCPKKCSTNFNPETRDELHRAFWHIANIEKQRQYISSLIDIIKKKSKRTEAEVSRRHNTVIYSLVKEGKKISVCQGFFLKTLDISETFVRRILSKRTQENIVQSDKRGHHIPANKRPEIAKQNIIDHINLFPRVPSHYCRKDTGKQYLASDLNVQIMYDLYKEDCLNKKINPEKLWYYRNIFNTECNLSFHTPRKDLCDKCFAFDHLPANEQAKKQSEHESHLKRKTLARNMKNSIKEKALAGDCSLAEFDLEAVRYCPKTNAKKLFYKRRLAVYNLTVFNVASKEAYNYVWHEGMAKRGSVEIASCIWKHLSENQLHSEHNFFSDTCSGQNRNVNMVSMFLYAVKNLESVFIINHFFFEPGHSMMECDSVHAHIEKKSRNVDIFDPSGWYAVIRTASRNLKYRVIEMDQTKFFDFNSLTQKTIRNKKIDTNGNKINWLKVVWFQFKKESPNTVFFKYEMDSEAFLEFDISINISVRRSVRREQKEQFDLERMYTSTMAISSEKHKNLMELCQDVIPKTYHAFYASLNECHGTDGNENISDQEDSD